MTQRKAPHEKMKPGRKPKASSVAVLALPVESPAEMPASLEPALSEPPAARVAQVMPRWDDPLQRNRSPDRMDEAELRQYGLQIGLSRRDAADLGVERLRVACKHRINDLIEDL